MARLPRALKSGDTLALVSPASPIQPAVVDFIRSFLADHGYGLRVYRHALDRVDYLAGTDADRAADLQAAFSDPGIAAVLCTRGGYGCARLFPYLDLDAIANSGRLLIGFSDITTLHLALLQRGCPALYAPMALTLSNPRQPWVFEHFLAALRGDFTAPNAAPRGTTLVPGVAEGPVTGGCLCLITDSIATPDAVETTGRILVIEDVDEAPHRVDAMLTHLRNTGQIQKAAGLVVGEMTRTDDHVDPTIGGQPWRDIVRDRVGDLGIPVIIDYPFGHVPNMLSVPLGLRARLDADAGTLTYLETWPGTSGE